MKVTKFGHSCLLIEDRGTRILTDPGNYSTIPDNLSLDAIVITHKHPDHCDIEYLQKFIQQKPCPIYTNKSVGIELDKVSIPYNLLEHGQEVTVGGITIEGFGQLHALMYPGVSQDPNVGYFFNNHLFHPGDSYTIPPKPIPVLALPVGGPWLKLAEAIDYAKLAKPTRAFPIHDGMFKTTKGTTIHTLPEKLLAEDGIQFTSLNDGESLEI